MKKSLRLILLLIGCSSLAQGKIIKFKADVVNKHGSILTITNYGTFEKKIKGNTLGHFETSFKAPAGMYQLNDGANYVSVYLKEGYDLKMKVNAKKFNETIRFSGIGAAENNFLAQEALKDMAYDYDGVLKLDEINFNKAIESKRIKDLEELNKLKLDPNFITLEKQKIEQNAKGMKQSFAANQAIQKLNGTVSPSFDYYNFAGGKTKLEDFKNKYVYIDIWTTWCEPCRAEISFLKKIQEKYRNKNIVFVSISIDYKKDFDKWKTFLNKTKLSGVQLFENENGESNFMKVYNVASIPRFILIDPSGKIINSNANQPSDPQLQEVLDKLL